MFGIKKNETLIRLGLLTNRIQLSLCEDDVQTGYIHMVMISWQFHERLQYQLGR